MFFMKKITVCKFATLLLKCKAIHRLCVGTPFTLFGDCAGGRLQKIIGRISHQNSMINYPDMVSVYSIRVKAINIPIKQELRAFNLKTEQQGVFSHNRWNTPYLHNCYLIPDTRTSVG